MSASPSENAELERAERAVARLPRRNLLPPRRPASRLGRVLTAVAPFSATVTVALEMKFWFAPTSVTSVLAALLGMAFCTVAICLAAGELGGRPGRISGIVSGILIVPPVGMVLAWWAIKPLGLLS